MAGNGSIVDVTLAKGTTSLALDLGLERSWPANVARVQNMAWRRGRPSLGSGVARLRLWLKVTF